MVSRLLRFLVEPGKRVLSIRSGPGQQLAEVRPAYGVGIDIAGEMVQVAKKRHPEFKFVVGFPDTNDFRELLSGEEPFDYILVNGIDDTVDVQSAFANLRALAKRETRVLIVSYNHLWEPMVILAEKFGLKVPTVNQNWLSEIDVANFLTISDYEALKTYRIVLLPKYIPLLSEFLNGFCARLPGLNRLCMVQVIVARVLPEPIKPEELKVSVIIPCKDERGTSPARSSESPDSGGKPNLSSATIDRRTEQLTRCAGWRRFTRKKRSGSSLAPASANQRMSGPASRRQLVMF